MNRNEEYTRLLAELENTPPALEHALGRAKARGKKHRLRRWVAAPIGTFVAVFLAFMALVNLSPPFALAMSRVPVLKELAAAVTFSPSLSAAVENDYVQPIGLEQTDNGVTMRIVCVIVDKKHLNVFYSLSSNVYSDIYVYPRADIMLSAADGQPLDEGVYSVRSAGTPYAPDGELQMMPIEFYYDEDMPGSVQLALTVADYGDETNQDPPVIAAFQFALDFDPAYTSQGEKVWINEHFVIDGQTLTVTSVETYPTYLRLNINGSATNAAWLDEISVYLENEKGERFESQGIFSWVYGATMEAQCRLDSPFFSQSKSLTLYITGATFRDKKEERLRVDLAQGVVGPLPEGTRFESAVREGDGWQLVFSGVRQNVMSHDILFDSNYYDEAGKEYFYSGFWQVDGENDPERFKLTFSLENYPEDVVYLVPYALWRVDLDTPIEIKVK